MEPKSIDGGYFWYNNQPKLQAQVSKFIIPTWAGMLFRRLSCLVMLVYFTARFIYNKSNINDVKYLTTWGVYLTTITFVLGSFGNNIKLPFNSQKCYIIMFQLTLVIEINITFAFWTTLYPHKDFKSYQVKFCEGRPFSCFQLFADHWIPLALLVIDFILS